MKKDWFKIAVLTTTSLFLVLCLAVIAAKGENGRDVLVVCAAVYVALESLLLGCKWMADGCPAEKKNDK